MKLARIFAAAFCVLAAYLLAAPAFVGVAAQQTPAAAPQTPAPAPPAPLVTATRRIVQPEEMAAGGRILGDPSKPGIYVQRVRWAPGRGSRPHLHDQDRHVTVISGTWWAAFGNVYDADKLTPIRAGGFIFHPAGVPHYDTARDEEVIVEIVGMGPVKTDQAEVDEKGQPVVRGARGRGAN
jgi:quercetin dioxygenase-like cupin family protein